MSRAQAIKKIESIQEKLKDLRDEAKSIDIDGFIEGEEGFNTTYFRLALGNLQQAAEFLEISLEYEV